MNNNLKNLEFNKIDLQDDTKINRKIINALSLVENKNNENLNDLSINSLFEVQETKKNSKGKVVIFKSKISLNITIRDKDKQLTQNFTREFAYNTKDNKFDLIQYQNEIKKNLINEIIEDIILFMNVEVIIKYFHLSKNLNKNINFFLLYGSNTGLIEETINNILKPNFSSNLFKYDEDEISDLDTFKEGIFSRSFFDNEKLIIISRGSDKI